jgi:hypothetical protein
VALRSIAAAATAMMPTIGLMGHGVVVVVAVVALFDI